jgi:hypothetical protein
VLKRMLHHITIDQAIKIDGELQTVCHEMPEYSRPIPPYAYCIWEGSRINDNHLNNLAKFLRLNEGYTLTVLTSNPGIIYSALERRDDGAWLTKRLIVQKPDYSSEPIIGGAIARENNGAYYNYASGSDIGRVYALAKTGGIYFDVDCVFKKKLPILRAPLGILTTCSNDYFYNGLLAAPESSEQLHDAIMKIKSFYDDRRTNLDLKRAPWLEEAWVSKRANLPPTLDQNDDRSIQVRLKQFIDEIPKIEANIPAIKLYEDQLEALKISPRQTITEETTVDMLLRAINDSLGEVGNYQQMRQSVNILGAMRESGDIELPMSNEWKNAPTRPRRVSL